jgi:hypothetical protein
MPVPSDAALLEREIVGKDLHARLCERRKRRRALRRTRGKYPVLHKKYRYLIPVVHESSGEVVVVSNIVRFEWIARFDEEILHNWSTLGSF